MSFEPAKLSLKSETESKELRDELVVESFDE